MMTATPTALDSFAAILILIILVISGFTLLGTGLLMAIGAVFSSRPLVTSWPAEQEHTFGAFERRSTSASATAWVLSIAGAVLVTFLAVGIYFAVSPEKREFGKDMNMSNLTKKRVPPPATRSDAAAPAEAAKPGAPAEAPKSDPPAPAEAPKQ
jgi:membrane protease YdiL (CAAX protease family)